jgi:hypothetical protein
MQSSSGYDPHRRARLNDRARDRPLLRIRDKCGDSGGGEKEHGVTRNAIARQW